MSPFDALLTKHHANKITFMLIIAWKSVQSVWCVSPFNSMPITIFFGGFFHFQHSCIKFKNKNPFPVCSTSLWTLWTRTLIDMHLKHSVMIIRRLLWFLNHPSHSNLLKPLWLILFFSTDSYHDNKYLVHSICHCMQHCIITLVAQIFNPFSHHPVMKRNVFAKQVWWPLFPSLPLMN